MVAAAADEDRVREGAGCADRWQLSAGATELAGLGRLRAGCDAVRHVAVAVYAFMVDGQRSETPRGTVDGRLRSAAETPAAGLRAAEASPKIRAAEGTA